jgi:exosome complex component RRP43
LIIHGFNLLQFLVRVLETSGCVATSDLAVCPGRLVWCLYIDLVCLDHSGNLWDCALAALVAALETVTLPAVSVDPDSGAITVEPGARTPLPLRSRPVSCTSAVFPAREGEAEARVVADPTWEEEQLAGASLSVVCLQSGEVCHVRQPGGRPVSAACLQACTLAARRQAQLVTSAVAKIKK